MLDRFYPIAPNAAWVARLAGLGVRTIQLRVKNESAEATAQHIRDSLAACKAHGAQLIVNDYWREAIDGGADYIHLGQEDLAAADLGAIRRAGLKLGVSTHDRAELETALAAEPDYVALGPIYETTLKKMRFAPQGLERIGEWKRLAGRPLVAIGGITLERAPGVFAAGADSIAVVSDVINAADPDARVKSWLAACG
ncbi:MAG: thiamine phosphate synthase [Hyphomicrobiales bacterium]|nr:thiamine phosphate synthase [Hyphomicrobiales bacterium]